MQMWIACCRRGAVLIVLLGTSHSAHMPVRKRLEQFLKPVRTGPAISVGKGKYIPAGHGHAAVAGSSRPLVFLIVKNQILPPAVNQAFEIEQGIVNGPVINNDDFKLFGCKGLLGKSCEEFL